MFVNRNKLYLSDVYIVKKVTIDFYFFQQMQLWMFAVQQIQNRLRVIKLKIQKGITYKVTFMVS